MATFAVVLLWAAAPAIGARGLETGFVDPLYTDGNAAGREFAFDRTVDANAGVVRVNVLWRTAAPNPPANPTNPADPAYNFAPYDTAVREAARRGLDVVLTVYRAPEWAEGANRPAGTPAGSWNPQPAALANFATALATRYSGSFAAPDTLPRVRYFQIWNEPNLTTYLNPQPQIAAVYTDLLNAAYGAIKAINPDNQVLTAGTAPYGDPPGGARTRPLTFWRGVLCATACAGRASFDILAHHPINTSGGPKRSAVDPDDVSTPDLGNLVSLLREAEAAGRTGTGGSHPVWVTEIWWESDPPDSLEGVPLEDQARFIQQALYLLWKQGASVVMNLQVRDSPSLPGDQFSDTATGVFLGSGEAKPSFTAMRFPFVTQRKGKRKLQLWGIAPESGRLTVQRNRKGKWEKVTSLKVQDDAVFKDKVELKGRATLRAKIGADRSLIWRQG